MITTAMLKVALFFILASCLVSGDEKKYKIDVRSLDFRDLRSMFYLLREYGLRKRPTSVPKSTRQYTSTVVVSEEELRTKAQQWFEEKKFPEDFTKDNRRVRVQYNTGKNEQHGENIILRKYLDDLIGNMQLDSRENGYNEYPIVLMYSYNIPCTLTDHTCAKNLAEDHTKRINSDKEYSMVIGYQASFGRTVLAKRENLEQAFKALVDGDIYVQRLVYTKARGIMGFFVQTSDSTEEVLTSKYTFQTLMYECLLGQPTTYCCTATPDNIATIQNIVSFFVNNMVYNCTFKSNEVGVFTNQNRNGVKSCFDKFINDHISGDCIRCSGRGGAGKMASQLFVSNCLDQSFDLAYAFGKPRNPHELYMAGWEMFTSSWKSIYQISPEEFLKTRPAIWCMKRTLTKDSLCSRSPKRYKSG